MLSDRSLLTAIEEAVDDAPRKGDCALLILAAQRLSVLVDQALIAAKRQTVLEERIEEAEDDVRDARQDAAETAELLRLVSGALMLKLGPAEQIAAIKAALVRAGKFELYSPPLPTIGETTGDATWADKPPRIGAVPTN